tara:strand:+ start:951 stop:1262 length:312 start_codon:yes stop_codon:yes gene_type:complete
MGLKLFDQYTYLHFATGIIMYFFGLPILVTIIIHTIFEIVENTNIGMNIINNLFKFWPGGKPYNDSIINCIGDTIGVLIGWISAYYIDNLGYKYGWYKKHIKL